MGSLKPRERKDDERLLYDLTSPENATPLMVRNYIDLVGDAWFLLAFACGGIMVAAAFLADQLLGRTSAQAVTGITFAAACFCMTGGIAVQWFRVRIWLALRTGALTNDRRRLSAMGLPTNRTIPIQLIVAVATALQTWLSHWTGH
jgi:hypothetical protein